MKPVYAVITNPILKNSVDQATKPQEYFNKALSTVISVFMLVGVVYFVWHFVMAGYHLIASHGDPKKFEQARDELTYSLLGLGVVFSVFAILRFAGMIFGITGLEKLQISWPTL